MMYITPTRRENGSYGNMQSHKAPGMVAFPDEFMPEFFKVDKQASGFCQIEHDGEKVTSCTWDEDAYQAYIASLPEPEPEQPTETEQLRADVDYLLMMQEG